MLGLMPMQETALHRAFTSVFDNQAINGHIKRLLPRRARDYLHRLKWKARLAMGYRLVPEEQLTGKYREVLARLVAEDGNESLGDYLEFGVFNGTSLACMHRAISEFNIPNMRLFGFDSFEGLPESANEDEWEPGTYQMDEGYARGWLTRRGIDWQRVVLVKGWFSDTLNQDLIDSHSIRKASVIMIDCDAYQSAKEALWFCAPLINERAVVFFDDWHSGDRAERGIGEREALEEFLQAHPQVVPKDLGTYSPGAKVLEISRVT
jgi:O-methyltransferase